MAYFYPAIFCLYVGLWLAWVVWIILRRNRK